MNKSSRYTCVLLLLLGLFCARCDSAEEDRALFVWEEVSGLSDNVVSALVVLPNQRVIAGTFYNGIHYKDERGAWQPTNLADTEIRALLRRDDGSMFAGTFGRGIWRSDDGGVTWSQVTEGPDEKGGILCLTSTDSGRLVAGIFNSNDFRDESDIYYSDDEGVSWHGVEGIDVSAVWSLASASDEDLYAGAFSEIYRSSDGDMSWEPVGLDEDIAGHEWTTMAVTESGIVLAGGDGILRSTNGGDSWVATMNRHELGSYETVLAVGDEAFAGSAWGNFEGMGGGVLHSTDGGVTWQAINEGTLTREVLSLAASNDKLYAGTSKGVFVAYIK